MAWLPLSLSLPLLAAFGTEPELGWTLAECASQHDSFSRDLHQSICVMCNPRWVELGVDQSGFLRRWGLTSAYSHSANI